jgi:hypothetical protein
LAFWAERYASRIPIPRPVNSKDIDFGDLAKGVAGLEIAAARLGDATKYVPEPFEPTPNSGVVEFTDSAGLRRRIDFLYQVHGLNLTEVFEMSIGVDVGDGIPFQVMHPIHCLESRICNVSTFSTYETQLGLDQARASVRCAQEYLRDRLSTTVGPRHSPVLRLNERIYRFAWVSRHSKKVYQKHKIDPFDAVLLDPRLPTLFGTLRYPHMVEGLKRRRSTW